MAARPVPPPLIQTSLAADRSHEILSPTAITPTSPFFEPPRVTEKIISSNQRVRGESRKLLAHVLQQLVDRPLPPSVYTFAVARGDSSATSFAAIAQTVRGVVKLRSGRVENDPLSPSSSLDEDDEEEDVFTTEPTLELMQQLRDVLIISAAQGWAIFEEKGSIPEARSGNKSPFRISRNRNSLQPSGRRSRSPSPGHPGAPPELLAQCISVLASVVMEDCRFQVHVPRPSRPPNSLQALVLDIAQFLLHTHRQDPKVVSEIGFAMIPAFHSFAPSMHVRLLSFFEDGVLRNILEDLARARGTPSEPIQREPVGNEPAFAPVSITVDVVADDEATGVDSTGPSAWMPWTASAVVNLRAATAPFQSQAIYCLSALIPPLLAAVLESVVLSDTRPDVAHRFHRLMQLIMTSKPDAWLDILEVAAYHSPARLTAMSLVSTFWPSALGHFVVARSLAPNRRDDFPKARDHPYTHHFVPWHFHSSTEPLAFGLMRAACHACSVQMDGFGLFCSHCSCSVHFGCYVYPEGSAVVQYSPDRNVQRVASFRFSPLLGNPRKRLAPVNGHFFHEINMFTLCLCFVCRRPLWGCTRQGVSCIACSQFAHSSCVDGNQSLLPCYGASHVVDASTMSIQWSDLRNSCLDHYGDILRLTAEQLASRPYEEISLISAVLWTQTELMTHGVSSGSIDIIYKGRSAAHAKDFKVHEFEIHRVLAWCNDLLLRPFALRLSMSFGDYLEQTGQQRSPHGLLFDWSTLIFIVSTIKSPFPLPIGQTNLLNVVDAAEPDDTVHILQPFEVLNVAHLRNMLGYEFTVYSDAAARLFLEHIFHLGFFEASDSTLSKDTVCSSPLPLGLDLSTTVETLMAAVEACLADIDLSVNEAGFLLLVRRLWPNGMSTDYSVKRTIRVIVSWILAEDDSLAVILRDYLAKQRPLPGIRGPSEAIPWPQAARATGATSGSMGGEYVNSRRALQSRYALKWFSELYHQNAVLYTGLVYEICEELAQQERTSIDTLPYSNEKSVASETADRLLRFVVRVAQTIGTPSGAFDAWLLKWLEYVSATGLFAQNMPSLHRLFPRDTDRMSTGIDHVLSDQPGAAMPFDPWRVVMAGTAESTQGFSEGLKRLLVFANSGIDIPLGIFERFSALATKFGGSLQDASHFVDALLASSWLRAASRNELQTVIADLHSTQLKHTLDCLASGEDVPAVIKFIRKSLGTCLLLFGDRKSLLELNLVLQEEIDRLPSRRRVNVRTAPVVDPIVLHPELLSSLEAYITTATNEEVTCIAANFLNAFLNESPYLESYEVDNFVLRNGRMLAHCAWQFYGIQRHEIYSTRTSFLLRVVLVDSQPFQELLHAWLLPTGQWELRLLAVSRLFRIILDVTSPSFNVEGRQWRSSIIEVFYRFFFALWSDEQEEIRIVVDTFSLGLLPAHLEAISLCWIESMAMPIAERVKLVSFLVQLRPYYPHWQVLSWDVLVDALSEEEDDINQTATGPMTAHLSLYGLSSSRDEVGVQSSNTDPNLAILRGSLLLLSLQMIADGIAIDSFTLQKIKAALVKAIGFSEVTVTPSVTGQGIDVYFGDAQGVPDASLPCLNELLSVLDSPHVIASEQHSYLVGSRLADVALNLFCTGELQLLPTLTLKSLVESLGVIIYKHDFEGRHLKHLQPTLRKAVLRALDLMLEDVSYEIRQLALSATQAFVKRWPAFIGTILYASIEQVSKLVLQQSHNTQDALVTQARSFVEYCITQYENTGFISSLFKRRLDQNVLLVLKEITDAKARLTPNAESLRDLLLRGLLIRGPENDHTTMQNFLNNLNSFVELVHHQGYSLELMRLAGQQLLSITRRVADLAGEGAVVDPTALLLIPALLIQHNKANSRELVVCADTILRSILLRLNVESQCISRLLHVTASLQRRTHLGEMAPIIATVFEITTDALRLKNRTPAGTVKALLEVIIEPLDHMGAGSLASTHPTEFQTLVDYGFYYLQNYVWVDTRSENDFNAALVVGKLILEAASSNNSIYGRMAEPTDRSGRAGLGIRAWNLMVLVVLLDSSDRHIRPMFDLFQSLANLHHSILRPFAQSSVGIESATYEINHAYITIRLWLLLAQRNAANPEANNATAFMVWNELWPPMEAMVSTLEGDLHLGLSMPVASLTWVTISDLFLFLRGIRSPLALDTQFQIAVLDRLRSHGGQDSAMSKLTRTARTLAEPLGDAVDLEFMVQEVGKDLVAAEKLRVLAARAASGA
ncbi:hypothetical protein HMN09_00080900 [Mycena chlorophos]|uniref:Phorbol-ester/DAG-type domain-containing protein n=1 Tax=Mycena chlorophos TaxID=658473 RepID=A0A8H6WMN9_MYCCL|nr:hypothetical protein HMN09_00080900 [Mycena chlorophos]